MIDPSSDLGSLFRPDRTWKPATRVLGHPIIYQSVVDSTQDLAHQAAQAGAPQGLVVLADEQRAGKGRLGRRWVAPFGSSLLMSILLRPDIPVMQAARLTMCVGLGAAEAVEAVTGLTIQLKWPNDLYLNSQKLAGLLTETSLEGERLVYAVIGLGLNVNVQFAAGDELAGTATSLAMVLGREISRVVLLESVLQHVEARYEELQRGVSPAPAWASRLVGLGETVQVSLTNDVLTGTAIGVSPDGALLLQTHDGIVHTIWAGDVTIS